MTQILKMEYIISFLWFSNKKKWFKIFQTITNTLNKQCIISINSFEASYERGPPPNHPYGNNSIVSCLPLRFDDLDTVGITFWKTSIVLLGEGPGLLEMDNL